MEIVRLILSILSSSCVIAFSIWYLLDTCDRSSKSKEERSISVEIIAYLYDHAKSGDDEAFELLYKLVKDKL